MADGVLSEQACKDASEVGTAIAVVLILILWFIAFVVITLIWFTTRAKSRMIVTQHADGPVTTVVAG